MQVAPDGSPSNFAPRSDPQNSTQATFSSARSVHKRGRLGAGEPRRPVHDFPSGGCVIALPRPPFSSVLEHPVLSSEPVSVRRACTYICAHYVLAKRRKSLSRTEFLPLHPSGLRTPGLCTSLRERMAASCKTFEPISFFPERLVSGRQGRPPITNCAFRLLDIAPPCWPPSVVHASSSLGDLSALTHKRRRPTHGAVSSPRSSHRRSTISRGWL